MSETMLERCARALAADKWDRGFASGQYGDQRQQWVDATWQGYVLSARAVLTALREPDERMIKVGHHFVQSVFRLQLKRAWQAMIDTILAEPIAQNHEAQ